MTKNADTPPSKEPTTGQVSNNFAADRCRQLKQLSREHDDCIAFAARIASIAADGTEADLATGIELVHVAEQHHRDQGQVGGTIVLFPRYQPDLVRMLADRLGLTFFDYQKEVMEDLGLAAEATTLKQLDQTLRARTAGTGIVCHNIEALLCVKTETERREWLQFFLDADWPNPVLLPITVFQADVPEERRRVCDLELLKMPAPSSPSASGPGERIPYDVG